MLRALLGWPKIIGRPTVRRTGRSTCQRFGDALSTFAGPSGVGALCLLAVFLFLDGRAPELFPTFELYAKTSTWSVVAAVPVVAISYVLGLSVMIASEQVIANVAKQSESERTSMARMVSAGPGKDSLAAQLYVDALRNRAVLAGGAMALALLGLGALSEVRNLPNLRAVIVVAALGAVMFSMLAAYLAVREGERANGIAASIQLLTTKPEHLTVQLMLNCTQSDPALKPGSRASMSDAASVARDKRRSFCLKWREWEWPDKAQ
jgi:hypothetical protein